MTPIQRAIEIAGGQTALGNAIGVTQGAVWQWANERKPVPAAQCIPIENATGVTRYELRPDVFGDAPPVMKTA